MGDKFQNKSKSTRKMTKKEKKHQNHLKIVNGGKENSGSNFQGQQPVLQQQNNISSNQNNTNKGHKDKTAA